MHWTYILTVIVVIITIIILIVLLLHKTKRSKKRDLRKTLLAESKGTRKNEEAIIFFYGNLAESFSKQIFPHSTFMNYRGNEKLLKDSDIFISEYRTPFCSGTEGSVIPAELKKGFRIYLNKEHDPNGREWNRKTLSSASPNAHLIITVDKISKSSSSIPKIYVPKYSLEFSNGKYNPLDLLIKKSILPIKNICILYDRSEAEKDEIGPDRKDRDERKDRDQFEKILKFFEKHLDRNIDILPSTSSLEILSNYKFVIVNEDYYIPGYISQKLTNIMLSGAIPVYIGAEDVGEHFNIKSFVYSPTNNLLECVNQILNIEKSSKIHRETLIEPWCNDNKLSSSFSWFTGGEFYSQLHKYLPKSFSLQMKASSRNVLDTTPSLSSHSTVKVINLSSSTDRWKEISKKLDDQKVEYSRFDAILGKKHYKQFEKCMSNPCQKMKEKTGRKFYPGELGVYLSNVELWKQLIKEKNLDYYVILEDDITPRKDFASNLRECIENAPKNWDMIFIGLNKNGCKGLLKDTGMKYHKMDSDCMPGAFGYIVNKKCAAYLARFSFDMNFPVDLYIPYGSRGLNIYSVNPLLVDADYENISTILNS